MESTSSSSCSNLEDKWEVVVNTDRLNEDLAKSAASIATLGGVKRDVKVYFDSKTEEFTSSNGLAQAASLFVSSWASAWMPTWMFTSVEAVGAHHIDKVKQRLTSRITEITSSIEDLKPDEMGTLQIKLMTIAANVSNVKDGLMNLFKNVVNNDNNNDDDIIEAVDKFQTDLHNKVGNCIQAINAKLNPAEVEAMSNPLTEGQQQLLLNAFQGLVPHPRADVQLPLLSANTVVTEGLDQPTQLTQQPHRHAMGSFERLMLNKFQINGESLKVALDRLTEEECNAMKCFVDAYVNECNGKGRSLADYDPSTKILRNVRIGGAPVLEVLPTVKSDSIDQLQHLVAAYHKTRGQS